MWIEVIDRLLTPPLTGHRWRRCRTPSSSSGRASGGSIATQSYLARSSSSSVTAPRGAAPANGAVPPANGAVPLANGARVSTAVVPATVVTAGTHEDRFHRLEQVVTELTASGALAAPVVLQTGADNTGLELPEAVTAVQFLEPAELAALMRSARLVITHGGPGSIFMALEADIARSPCRAGRPRRARRRPPERLRSGDGRAGARPRAGRAGRPEDDPHDARLDASAAPN